MSITPKFNTMKKIFLFLGIFFIGFFFTHAQTYTTPFTESFEYSLNKWTDNSSGGTVEVTPTQSKIGNQSLHITGTATGIQIDFSNSAEVQVISYFIRVSGGSGGTVLVGNSHSAAGALFLAEISGGQFIVTGSTGSTTLCSVANDEWLKVEVRNINYVKQNYDVYINDSLHGANLSFNANVSGVTCVDIYNNSSTDEAWWDALFIGANTFNSVNYTGNDICMGDMANLVFTEDVAIDSLGNSLLGTNFTFGPFTSDSNVNYQYPYYEHLFDGMNGYDIMGGNMFDVTPNKNIRINSFDIKCYDGLGAGQTARIYYRTDSYVGHNTDSAGWVLLDTITFFANPNSIASRLELHQALMIPAGETYGIYICNTAGVRYTNGSGTNETNSNDDLTVYSNAGGAYFDLTFIPRVWNGRILYSIVEEHEDTHEITTTGTGTTFYASSGAGNMFDVIAKNDIVIDSLDVSSYGGGVGWVSVYYREGSYASFTTTSDGWALLETVNLTLNTNPATTRVPLSNQLYIPAGQTYGIYIMTSGGAYYYDAGFASQIEDSNIVITDGHSGNSFDCTTSSRFWRGTVYYTVHNVEAVEMNPEVATYNSTSVRGYSFTSPADFKITGLRVPDDNAGNQWLEVVKFSYPMPIVTTTNGDFAVLARFEDVSGDGIVPCNILIQKGDHIGVLGYRKDGANTPVNSYSIVAGPDIVDIMGFATEFYRCGNSSDFTIGSPTSLYTYSAFQTGRIEMYIENVSPLGGVDSVPIIIHTPVPDLGVDTSLCAGASITLNPGTFDIYDWSNSAATSTLIVDTTGVGIDTATVWVTVTDQYGCTASDTISVFFIDCTGIEENEIFVKVYPNPSSDVFYISTENVNEVMFVQVFSLDGRLVSEKEIHSSLEIIDMSAQLPGVYSLRLILGNQVKEMRIILQ